MNQLSVGFARVNITPMIGLGIVGYFVPRFADGVAEFLIEESTKLLYQLRK